MAFLTAPPLVLRSRLSPPSSLRMSSAPSPSLSRRSVLSTAALATAAAVLPSRPAAAADLQPFKDLGKGFSLLRPQGWNEFDGAEGQYDVKWVDVIQPLEFITILTSPVGKGGSLGKVGTPEDVGRKVAEGRGGELVKASVVDAGGEEGYLFEITKNGNAHQLTLLVIAKSKLYSINASCSEKRWGRREKLLREVVGSFKPKL